MINGIEQKLSARVTTLFMRGVAQKVKPYKTRGRQSSE